MSHTQAIIGDIVEEYWSHVMALIVYDVGGGWVSLYQGTHVDIGIELLRVATDFGTFSYFTTFWP